MDHESAQLNWQRYKMLQGVLAVSGTAIACYKALVKPEEKLRQRQISHITGENTFALLLAINDH